MLSHESTLLLILHVACVDSESSFAGISMLNGDHDSTCSQSAVGEDVEVLKLKFKISVNPKLTGKYKPKKIEPDDLEQFFIKVMKINQECMSTINWSTRRVTLNSFICTMYLNDPEVYDKTNYQYVTNGNFETFGEMMKFPDMPKAVPRWIATFETSSDRSGVAFIVQKPLSKGLTRANKFELCAQLRKRHEICSDMYDVKHNTDNPTLAESSSDDWLFFALFVSPDFEYPLFTSGPIPFTVKGKNVFLSIRRKENLQQLEERLRQTEKTEAEIKAIIAKKRTENYLSGAKMEQKLEKATMEEARATNALAEIEKINVVEPTLNKKEYLTILIQQAQTKFEKDRYAAKRAILLREEKKKSDKDHFEFMIKNYSVDDPNSSKWKQLMTTSMRNDLCLFMKTYDEKAKIEDKRVQDHYDELYGHLDENLEAAFKRYNLRAGGDLPFSPIGGSGQAKNSHERLESTQNKKTLHDEILESNRKGAKRPRTVTPENMKSSTNKSLANKSLANKSAVSDNNDNVITSNTTRDRFEKELEGLDNENADQNKTLQEDLDLERLTEALLATPIIGKATTKLANQDQAAVSERVKKFRQDLEWAEQNEFNQMNGELRRTADFLRSETIHVPTNLSHERSEGSPTKLAGNSKSWGHWNKRKWNYFIHAQEIDGINCLKHNMEWMKDNVNEFMGLIFTRTNVKDHLNALFSLMEIARNPHATVSEDEIACMKAALYFLGPRNKGSSAYFSRENLKSLDLPGLKNLVGRLVDMMELKRSPPKVDSLVPIWIQAMTLLSEDERHNTWSYGATKLGIYARPHLGPRGRWRLLNGPRRDQFIKRPDDAIGTNIVGDTTEECLWDAKQFG